MTDWREDDALRQQRVCLPSIDTGWEQTPNYPAYYRRLDHWYAHALLRIIDIRDKLRKQNAR